MTLAILPLGLAPVCYGYILNLCSTRRLLQLTTALCALVLLAASFTTAFWQLLALRTLTGLLVPAILLALMTHISLHSRQESLQRAMAIYTTTTMFGAFLALDPDTSRRFIAAVGAAAGDYRKHVQMPVLLASMDIRRYVRRLIEGEHYRLPVVSYQELTPEISVQPMNRIRL